MDEQIAWFEAKITSSLRPRGDEIKAFTADIDSRYFDFELSLFVVGC